MTRWRIAQAAVVLVAAAAAVLPTPVGVVERWYSGGWYPAVQRVVTPASNLVPFALFDLLIAGALLGVALLVGRAVRRARATRRAGPLLVVVIDLCSAGAAVYLVFLALWGLNYRRLPMEERLVLSREMPADDAALKLGFAAVGEINQLHAAAHEAGWAGDVWRDGSLRTAFAATQGILGDRAQAVPGRLKWTLLGPYFRWASVDAMVDPFALETLVNPDLLPWERPFVAAHEWAHLAGYAHEAEANFVGWLACLRAEAPARYSGWLYLYWQLASEVSSTHRRQLRDALQPGPMRDLQAISDRLQRGRSPTLERASWRAYDTYLRANRVPDGVRSYGEVVSLILRARFDEAWTPARRDRN
jgi:hypothetical protein